MKIIKSFFNLTAYLLALIVIVISLGSAICKFTDLPEDSIFQIFGYLSYHWIVVLSIVILVFFLLLRNFRIALLYLGLMIVFTILLDDFSLNFMHHKKSVHDDVYDSLSVISYNVKYYAYGIEHVSRFLKRSDYDVALLSESVLTKDKLDYLKKNLTEYSIFTDNGHDLSILSRYPVSDYKIIELPTYLASFSCSNDIDSLKTGTVHRSFVHATISVNETQINVLSVRLIAGRPKDKSVRESIRWGKYLLNAQNEELSVFLSYLQTLKGPVIFGGDLNVSPNTSIIRRIKQYTEDTYLDNHAFGSFTFKVSIPTMRLDYLFHSKGLISEKSKIVKPDTLLSDHFPISAKYIIPRKISRENR